MAKITCVVVTPEQTALETEAEFIAVPLFDGELGIAPGRAPLIGRLGYGELRLKNGGATTTWYVDGGFVQVADNTVSILTGKAMPADKIDLPAAERHLANAKEMAGNTEDLYALRAKAITQATAQIRTAKRAK